MQNLTVKRVVLGGLVVYYGLFNFDRVDQNVLRPTRNYRLALQQWNRIQTQDEFHQFIGDLSIGLVRILPIIGPVFDEQE